MPDLQQFQSGFADALLAGRTEGAPAAPGMAVYRNTWRKALVEALEANYPVVAALVGEEAFRALALQFIGARGAPSPVLAGYGADYPDFVERHSVRESVPYLADVARIERLATEAHLAPDAEPMPFDEFVVYAERHAARRLRLHPAVRFCWLDTPARTIWEAHQGPSFKGCAPEWQAEGALVHRPGAAVRVEPLSLQEHALLEALRAGATLQAAVRRAERAEPGADASVGLVRLAGADAFLDFISED